MGEECGYVACFTWIAGKIVGSWEWVLIVGKKDREC